MSWFRVLMLNYTLTGSSTLTLGLVEMVAPEAQSISGEADVDFLRSARAQINGIFVEHTWVIDTEWDPNANFFRLVNRGPLQKELTDVGTNVYNNHLPHPREVPLTYDIERDMRSAGIPFHTDRWADHIREDNTQVNLDSFRGYLEEYDGHDKEVDNKSAA
jgi:hypothetical protein